MSPRADSLAEPLSARMMDSVVKVFCVHAEPNFSQPWQRKRQAASTLGPIDPLAKCPAAAYSLIVATGTLPRSAGISSSRSG